MDRIGARGFGNADDFLDGQIGRNRPHTFADLVGFVSFETVEGQFVLFGVDRYSAFPEFVCRAHNANGNLAAVGD